MIDNTVDTTTGTIHLKATFDNQRRHALARPVRHGAVLTLDTIQNATVVPAEAVQAGQQGQFVYVVKADNTVEIRPVIGAGRAFGKQMVIEKGIAPGETVVTDGQLRLFPGAQVQARGRRRSSDAGQVMNLSRIFIERPVMTALVVFAILLFGAIAFRGLPVAALPSVDYPTISGDRGPARRQSGDHGLLRGHAARTRVLHHRRHLSR